MKVIVCGGRDYSDIRNVFLKLDEFHADTPISELMQGGAVGADYIAKTWAEARGVIVHTIKADWKKNGRSAGPIRNGEMLKWGPDVVIAFPGGVGTEDMKSRSKKAMIRVVIFE
jgi:hypothetical protein